MRAKYGLPDVANLASAQVVFDEKLTLRHTGDFAGEPENVYLQWYYKPDINGIPPLFPKDQDELVAEGWVLLDAGWICI